MGNLKEFEVLQGFKFIEAYDQMANCNDGTKTNVTTLRFHNDKHVGIDIDLVNGKLFVSKPYEINDNLEPI